MKLGLLLWQQWSIKVFTGLLLIAGILTATSTLDRAILAGIDGAILLILFERIIQTCVHYQRLNKIAGTYNAYSYLRDLPAEKDPQEKDGNDDPGNTTWHHKQWFKSLSQSQKDEYYNDIKIQRDNYNTRKEISNGCATLTYKGGKEFELRLVENNGNIWLGQMEFTEINMASIAWYYKNDHLRDIVGHKKAVILDQSNPLRIYLFSDDGQRFGREILIKEEGSDTEWPSRWPDYLFVTTTALLVLLAIASSDNR